MIMLDCRGCGLGTFSMKDGVPLCQQCQGIHHDPMDLAKPCPRCGMSPCFCPEEAELERQEKEHKERY